MAPASHPASAPSTTAASGHADRHLRTRTADTQPDQAPREPQPTNRARVWGRRLVMWAAVGLSAALAGVLLVVGWDGRDAWTTAAGELLVACVAVCTWGAAQGRIADREIQRAVARLAAARRDQQRHCPSSPEIPEACRGRMSSVEPAESGS